MTAALAGAATVLDRVSRLRRQLAAMVGLPMNPSQIRRRHELLNEIDLLEAMAAQSPAAPPGDGR